ncbi:hypothetical protein V8C26DRAFT_386392 [Trichoderma gracile]
MHPAGKTERPLLSVCLSINRLPSEKQSNAPRPLATSRYIAIPWFEGTPRLDCGTLTCMPPLHHVACHTGPRQFVPHQCAQFPGCATTPRLDKRPISRPGQPLGFLVLPMNRWIHTSLCCLLPAFVDVGRTLLWIRSRISSRPRFRLPARMAVCPCRQRLMVVDIDSGNRIPRLSPNLSQPSLVHRGCDPPV